MYGALLALGSSLAWGLADFAGGLVARRLNALNVAFMGQIAGLAVCAVWLAAVRDALPPADQLALGAAAGLATVVAITSFYRALAIGPMSIVAPVVGTGVAIPVLIGIIGGDRPSAIQIAGMCVAGVGVIVAGRQRDDGDGEPRGGRGGILAALAAIGFGVSFWLLKPATTESLPWGLTAGRGVATIALALTLYGSRMPLFVRPRPSALGGAIAAGVLSLVATGLFAAATHHGLLSVIAVLGSLYPAVTVVLAHVFLGERLDREQLAGVVALVVGIPLMTL